MSNEMVTTEAPVDLKALQTNPNASDAIFSELAKGGNWLPRLQLFSTASKEVKAGKTELINQYVIVKGKDNFDIVGKEIPVLPLSWRAKAMQFHDGSVISKFDPTDDGFKKIAEKSGTQNSGCMYGPEFLLYVPDRKAFVSFFMGSVSARIEAPNLKSFLDEQVAATLGSKFLSNKKGAWQSPTAKSCTTPFEVPEDAAIIEQVAKFNNPPKDEVEAADAGTGDRAR